MHFSQYTVPHPVVKKTTRVGGKEHPVIFLSLKRCNRRLLITFFCDVDHIHGVLLLPTLISNLHLLIPAVGSHRRKYR